jgi:hypothetical protein
VTEPLTELGSWESGLLEGVIAATVEGERAEADELARELESLGYEVAVEAEAVRLTHLLSGRVLRLPLEGQGGLALRLRR